MLTLEEILGKEATNELLTKGALAYLIGSYPKDNLNKDFDFSVVSTLALNLEEKYGVRGGRGFSQRIGRAAFPKFLKSFGALVGAEAIKSQPIPFQSKVRKNLVSIAKIFSEMSDQLVTLDESEFSYTYTIHRCSNCWGRAQEIRPVCYLQLGFIQEALRWASGGKEFRVHESKCLAMGDNVCEFTIKKAPLSQ